MPSDNPDIIAEAPVRIVSGFSGCCFSYIQIALVQNPVPFPVF